jgi:hypothetical protein
MHAYNNFNADRSKWPNHQLYVCPTARGPSMALARGIRAESGYSIKALPRSEGVRISGLDTTRHPPLPRRAVACGFILHGGKTDKEIGHGSARRMSLRIGGI